MNSHSKIITENNLEETGYIKSVKENTLAFYGLVMFTFAVYIMPQSFYPSLKSLHIAQISAIFAIFAHVIRAINQKKPIIIIDKETRLLLVIVFLALLSIPFSKWPGGSFEVFQGQFIKSIIIFLLIAHILTSIKLLKKMIWILIYFCTFLSIIGIKNYLTGNVMVHDRIKGVAGGIAGNPNDLALTIVLIIPFALSFFIISKGFRKIISGMYVIIATIAIFCTFSRGGFLTLFVVYGVSFLMNLKRKGPKIVFLALILLVIFLAFMPDGYWYRLSSIADFAKDPTGSSWARKATTEASLSLMLENPITGFGLGMNILSLNEKNFFWQVVHNVYLQIGTELGIPAMIIFIIFLLKIIKNMHKIQKEAIRFRNNNEIIFIAQGVEISLIGFFIAAFFYPVAYNFYFYYLAGLAMAINRVFTDTTKTYENVTS